jgi:hypothetical protein
MAPTALALLSAFTPVSTVSVLFPVLYGLFFFLFPFLHGLGKFLFGLPQGSGELGNGGRAKQHQNHQHDNEQLGMSNHKKLLDGLKFFLRNLRGDSGFRTTLIEGASEKIRFSEISYKSFLTKNIKQEKHSQRFGMTIHALLTEI